MAKTRAITIKRKVMVEVPKKGTKNGETERVPEVRSFVVRINSAVPFSHRLCEENVR